ncbi:MAG: tetratricopeptide repeat protein [Burkholderiales bacterium]
MTALIDALGHHVSGANTAAIEHYEAAAHELRCLISDPLATINRALAEAPEMSIAHTLRAWLHLLGTEAPALVTAREAAEAAAHHAGTDRERMHARAAALVAAGRWYDGGQLLEDISAQNPRDLLALQAGHQVDFFTGDSRMLRDRVARVRPHWNDAMPGHHAVLGMHAFGLEETGDYAQAERVGRRAIDLQPRDTWAWHAVAHVYEMRNAPKDGIAWLEPNAAHWSRDSFLAVHNWWHLALFKLEQDRHDDVLAMYDASIGGPGSAVVLEMIDQSALLWRLALRGVDVGDRWKPLAERWAPHATAGNYAFNDLHAMMAFASAGRSDLAAQLREAQRTALGDEGDNRAFTSEVGEPATRAVQAFVANDHATVVSLLRPIRSRAHRFGGSHAQRDLLDLTLIEAASRSGNRPLAAALVAERVAIRPASPLVRRVEARVAA